MRTGPFVALSFVFATSIAAQPVVPVDATGLEASRRRGALFRTLGEAALPPDGTTALADTQGDARLTSAFTPWGDGITLGTNTVSSRIAAWLLGDPGSFYFYPSTTLFRAQALSQDFDTDGADWTDGGTATAFSPDDLSLDPAADMRTVTVERADSENLSFAFDLRGTPGVTGDDTAQYFVEFFSNSYQYAYVLLWSGGSQLQIYELDIPGRVPPFGDIAGYSAQTAGGRLYFAITTAEALPDDPAVQFGDPYFSINVGNDRFLRYEYVRSTGDWVASLVQSQENSFYSQALPVTVNAHRSGATVTLDVALEDLGLENPYLSLAVSSLSHYDDAGVPVYAVLDRAPAERLAPHTCACSSCDATAPSAALKNTPVAFNASYTAVAGAPAGCSSNLVYNWSFGDGTSATGPAVSHAYAGSSGRRRTYGWTVTVTSDGGEVFFDRGTIAISPPQPTVTGISPTSGWAPGGDTVVIQGTNFEQGDLVHFGDEQGTVTALTSTSITVTTPRHRAGAVSVTVEHGNCPPVAAPVPFNYVLGTVSGLDVYQIVTDTGPALEVTWYSYDTAEAYEIWRATTPTNWTLLAVVPSSWVQEWYEDRSVAAPDRAYLYKVRPVDGAHKGAFTAVEYGTTVGSTNFGQSAVIRAADVQRLRAVVNSLRVAAGLPLIVWTDASLPGRPALAAHVNELKSGLTGARTSLGRPETALTSVAAGQQIQGAHLAQFLPFLD